MYSLESIKAGALKVIGFDIDINSIDRLIKFQEKIWILPLYFNAMNPSGKLDGMKLKDLVLKIGRFDAMIALALNTI